MRIDSEISTDFDALASLDKNLQLLLCHGDNESLPQDHNATDCITGGRNAGKGSRLKEIIVIKK
jgi:GTP-binding protein EngB required for normal cell division